MNFYKSFFLISSMIWCYSNQLPEPVITYLSLGQQSIVLNIFRQENKDTTKDCLYKYATVSLKPSKLNYKVLMNAIIRLEYSVDDMQTIQNNYLLDQEDEEAQKDFLRMQEYRKESKQEAIKCMEYIEEHNLWKGS